jgi:hypothetical protein
MTSSPKRVRAEIYHAARWGLLPLQHSERKSPASVRDEARRIAANVAKFAGATAQALAPEVAKRRGERFTGPKTLETDHGQLHSG